MRCTWFAVPLCLSLLAACGREPVEPVPSASRALSEQLGGDDVEGYARAFDPRPFEFPGDHGPHPDYRNEWWYLTGNLDADDGRRFGFQVTFFRIALAPGDADRPSAWGTRQVWMAHAALSDAGDARHVASERFARGALGLAGARAEPFRVWLEDWVLEVADGAAADGAEPSWRLTVNTSEMGFELYLKNMKNIVLQGESGLSQKGPETGNASYYYSLPRLATRGRVRIGADEFRVTGLAWLDREWSTSALGPGQVGWDWLALQFDDGRDLMFYRLRTADGQADPHSAGTWNGVGGEVRALSASDVELEPLRWWQDEDGVRYPVAWDMRVRDGGHYRVEAVFDEQRMQTLVGYWEGMVDVFDRASNQPLGRGYLEMTGYE